MSDNAELHSKILTFLAGEFARKDLRQCIAVDLDFSPSNGFKDETIRKWVRADEPDLFDVEKFVHVEKLVAQIVEIAEGEADAKPAGKYRFVVRTLQHGGARATHSFALSPRYTGSDDTALAVGGGGVRQDVMANHAGQLMRINAQMFDGALRALSQSNMKLHEEITDLRSENFMLRRENDELKSNKTDREFQIAMAMEKNARTNAGFQKLLQIGTVVAAKIGGGDEAAANGGSSSLAMLIDEFGKSLRKEQMAVLMNTLDMGQKIMFMEIMKMVRPPESADDAPGGGVPLPSSGGPNGTPT